MQICPGCSRSAKVSEKIVHDTKKKGKHWLITYCARCGYNYDLEEYKGEVLSPQDEMNKYQWPENKIRWPRI